MKTPTTNSMIISMTANKVPAITAIDEEPVNHKVF